MRRLGLVLTAVLALGLLAACGNDDAADASDSTPAVSDAARDTETGADADSEPSDPPGGEGTVTVDGAVYDLGSVRSCEPVDDAAGVEELFSLIASGPQGSTLDLYINEVSGSFGHGLMWSGPEGIFDTHVTGVGPTWIGDGDISYDGPVIDTDGGRATGSATLVNSFTMDPSDTIDIAFDVEIPTSLTTC